jgi:hypothetical protein
MAGEDNRDVMEFAGKINSRWNYKKAYTGALVTDWDGFRWMYTTKSSHPCRQFKPKDSVEMKGYYVCCDSGRVGKCVFGGRWIGDADGKPINTDQ